MIDEQVREIRATIGFTNPAVEAAVHYGKNSHKGELTFVDHEVDVVDARTLAIAPTLEENGFELILHRTMVTNFRDRAEVETVYREEMARLIQERTGAGKVVIFHMHIRDNSKAAHEDIRRPASVPHVDYDENTFRIRAAEQLGDNASAWLSRPFVAINIWRGVEPVEEMPLALCDARSVELADFRKTIIHEKPREPTPYAGMPLTHDPRQRWYYFPDMAPDEALLFKQCDSDHSRTQWSPHVAICDPSSRPGGRPRVSFEARAIAFF
jgi:hypothetical protein